MSLPRRLDDILDRPAIELDTPEALLWKERADRLYGAWPDVVDTITDKPLSARDEMRTLKVIETILEVIAVHPPALPCHGVTHTIRVLSHGLRIARRDHLAPIDLLRLELAAACHDLGRLLLHRDGELRHADVSAVLLEDLNDDLDLPRRLLLPVRMAVLMHSARRPDYLPITPRVIDDVRSADKIDALDEGGFVRAMMYQGANLEIDISPSVGLPGHMLHGWWKNIIHEEPVLVSLRERRHIRRVRARNRRIGEELSSYRAPAELLEQNFREAVALVEPDANQIVIAQTVQRLGALPLAQRRNWSGVLMAVVDEVRRHEARRIAELSATAHNGRTDLIPLAEMLLKWSFRVQRIGEERIGRVA